jgi:hypothetical protein
MSLPQAVAPRTQQGFGVLLAAGLAVPAMVAIGALCTQLAMKFPPRSPAAAMTALTFMMVSAVELIPVTVAVTRLIRVPETRGWRSYALTIVGTLTFLPALAIYLAVMLE